MERKLSHRALRMRQRFTFRRGRDRASTLPPSGATSTTTSSRPRSATMPSSSHSHQTTTTNTPTYHRTSTDYSRYFHFTDEPGYFRPVSPLINRQPVPEELEDEVKHACALLVQSVDRGLPIWPSFQKEHRSNTTNANVHNPDTSSRFYYQGASMSPSAVDNQIKTHTSLDKMHDSGVVFQHRAASASMGRFYGTQRSASMRHKGNDQGDTQRGRSRSRSQSFGTDATPASRSRSRSLSPDMFPYSPPQVDLLWPHVKDISFDSPDALFPETETDSETAKDTDGMTWPHASLDIHRIDTVKTPASININVTAMPAAAPRRFYSMRQPREKERYAITDARLSESRSRTPSVDDDASVRSFPSRETEDGPQSGGFYHLHRSTLSGRLEQERDSRDRAPGYAIVSGGAQKRRRKASHLLRKLTGLGRKKDGVELERAVVVA